MIRIVDILKNLPEHPEEDNKEKPEEKKAAKPVPPPPAPQKPPVTISALIKKEAKPEEKREPPKEVKAEAPVEAKKVLPTEVNKEVVKAAAAKILGAAKMILSKSEVDYEAQEQGEQMLCSFENLIAQELLNRNFDFNKLLETVEGNENYLHAFKAAIISVKIGMDSRFRLSELADLATVTFISDLRAANLFTAASLGTLTQSVGTEIFEHEKYKKIVELVKIYQTAKA